MGSIKKQRESYYLDVEVVDSIKSISINTMISKNKIVNQALKDFVTYFNLTGKIKRENA